MAPRKILEAEIWCPMCKHYTGKVWKVETRDGFFEHMTEPESTSKYCNVCESVLVRRKK
jgi:hypothetical protein